MEANPKGEISSPGPKPAAKPSKVRIMSVETAKKLISKTSAEHSELFRRLAQ